jgi:glycosyltransferase involved in cell wall biosynthesis
MRVVIVHHHLQTGGVTAIIERQIEALQALGLEIVLVVGDGKNKNFPGISLHECKELLYLERNLTREELDLKSESLRQFFQEILQKEDILHIHNPNLGKNPLLNLMMLEWLEQGFQIINHCHDFAEDHRPENMDHLREVIEQHYGKQLVDTIYPLHDHFSYIVINGRDNRLLNDHGIVSEKILYAPNPMIPVKLKNPVDSRQKIVEHFKLKDPQHQLVVYPVRAILRKNIGEVILLANLMKEQAVFFITQAPSNPQEIPEYERWKSFCAQHNISVMFEAGEKMAFEELMSGADAMVTTSIREGFGMAFLEPWLWGKPLFGRDLPDITIDFKNKGLQFPQLYAQLDLDCLDFAYLSEEEKRTLILETCKNEHFAKQLMASFKCSQLLKPPSEIFIEHQKKLILEQFSLSTYGQQLVSFYARTVS